MNSTMSSDTVTSLGKMSKESSVTIVPLIVINATFPPANEEPPAIKVRMPAAKKANTSRAQPTINAATSTLFIEKYEDGLFKKLLVDGKVRTKKQTLK